MNRFKFIIQAFTAAFLLQGCSKVLEPISFKSQENQIVSGEQEEFSINIESLTFISAKKANKDPYPRQLMRKGAGSEANVFDETELLLTQMPKNKITLEYIIGTGDELEFIQLNEFINEAPQWPDNSQQTEYLLGIGDRLQFILLKENLKFTNLDDQ